MEIHEERPGVGRVGWHDVMLVLAVHEMIGAGLVIVDSACEKMPVVGPQPHVLDVAVPSITCAGGQSGDRAMVSVEPLLSGRPLSLQAASNAKSKTRGAFFILIPVLSVSLIVKELNEPLKKR